MKLLFQKTNYILVNTFLLYQFHLQLVQKFLFRFEIENQIVYEQGVAHIEKGQYEEGIDCFKNIAENSAYYIEIDQKIADAENKMAQAIEKQKQEDAAKKQAVEKRKALNDIHGALNHYANGEITASLQNLERVL